MRATLKHIQVHGPAISSYFFEPDGRFRFVAGEYTELYVPHENPDNRGESRKFTIASAPHSQLVEIVTTFSTPASTFKQALQQLKPGDRVQLSETTGDFVLPKDTSIPLRFVAAGVGISPVLSMARWLAHKKEHRDIAILHGASDTATFSAANDLRGVRDRYVPILRHADTNWSGQTGMLSGDRIMQMLQPAPNALIYLAGPEQLIEELHRQLLQQNIARSQIVTDLFTGY